jgi:hypothetical protein
MSVSRGIGWAACAAAALGLGAAAMGSYSVVSYDYFIDYHWSSYDPDFGSESGGDFEEADSPFFFDALIGNEVSQTTSLSATTLSSYAMVDVFAEGEGFFGGSSFQQSATSSLSLVFDLDTAINAQLAGTLSAQLEGLATTNAVSLSLQRDGDGTPLYEATLTNLEGSGESTSLAIDEILAMSAGRWTLIATVEGDPDPLDVGSRIESWYDFTLTIPGPGAAALLAFGLVAPRRRRG